MLGGHLQHRRGVRAVREHPRPPVQRPHELHLHRHVAVVHQVRLVDPQRHARAPRPERVDRRDPRGEPQPRGGVVADRAAAARDDVELRLAHPVAVAQRHVRPQQAQRMQVLDRAAPQPLAREVALAAGLQQVHVHRRAEVGGGPEDRLQRPVGQPVQVGRRQRRAHVIGPRPLPPRLQAAEEVHLLGHRDLRGGEARARPFGEIRRRPPQHLRVRRVAQHVAVADHPGESRPHPDVVIGVEHGVGGLVPDLPIRGKVGEDVVDAGGPALQHLDGREQGVEAQGQLAHGAEARQPQLQRREGHARHQRRQAEMVVAVGEAGHGDQAGTAEAGQPLAALRDLGRGPDLGDPAGLDADRGALVDDHRAGGVDAAQDVAGLDDQVGGVGIGHRRLSFQADAPGRAGRAAPAQMVEPSTPSTR